MSLMDDYFTANSIDIDSIIEDMMLVFSPMWYKPAVLKSVNYIIPARGLDENGELNEYEYVRIPIQDKIIQNILNAVTLKSPYADIKTYVDAEVTLDEADYNVYDRYGNVIPDSNENGIEIAFHGRNIFMNNAEDETIITVQYSEVEKSVDSIYEEIYRYLKQCFYYAMVSDYNGLYQSINLLSNAKSNVIAKNIHTEKVRRSNQVFNIGLFQI